jgi:hypothetical protein
MSLIQNRGFRNTVLRSLVGLYRGLSIPDYVNMCQCLIFLEDPLSVAEILDKLVQGEEENRLMAYQIRVRFVRVGHSTVSRESNGGIETDRTDSVTS